MVYSKHQSALLQQKTKIETEAENEFKCVKSLKTYNCKPYNQHSQVHTEKKFKD